MVLFSGDDQRTKSLRSNSCEFRKDEHGGPSPERVPHGISQLPTSEEVEPRQSCEHRVGVLILRDYATGITPH